MNKHTETALLILGLSAASSWIEFSEVIMTVRLDAGRVLVADGIGCTAAAAALLASEHLADAVGLSSRTRWTAAAALGTTSAMLLAGAAPPGPTSGELKRAALINLGWTTTCLLGLRGRPSSLGAALLVGTAAFDTAAGIAQWRFRTR